MTPRLDRRLFLAGSVAAAGLLVAGCSDDGGDGDDVAGGTGTTETTDATTSTSAAAASGTSGSCELTPEQTEGPYYVDTGLERADITEGRPGTPLALALSVVDAGRCTPIDGAVVDIWHCDAEGTYSGVDGDDGTFLRGIQRTGDDGVATFATVYPGWYPGRAVHVHVKVHTGGDTVHTGQLYFDEDVTDAVYRAAPYSSHTGRRTGNASDGIFARGGDSTTITAREDGDGYRGTMTLVVRTT